MPDRTLHRTIEERLYGLKADLEGQGRLTQQLLERAVESIFEKDPQKARWVLEQDLRVDAEDVRIEREAVQLLMDAMAKGVVLDESHLRLILTLVKVNNEFERNGDLSVNIAEKASAFAALPDQPPAKFRVMANSVIGIAANTNVAFAGMDPDAARLVLSSDDATNMFRDAILRDVEDGLAKGRHTLDFAFGLHTVASALGRIADHCTNVAEQVIYVTSGKIVRHLGERWTTPESPG